MCVCVVTDDRSIVKVCMGSGASPAGQVLAGPLFFALLIIHKMRGVSLGLICFLEITAIFLSMSH